MENLELYKNIRRFRKELNMSQEELALKVGYKGRSTISMIEKGAIDLSDSMIRKIAYALNCSPAQLRGETDEHLDYLFCLMDSDGSVKLSTLKNNIEEYVKQNEKYQDLFEECMKVKEENIDQVIAIIKTFE